MKVRQLKQTSHPGPIHTVSISLRKVFYTGPWLIMVINFEVAVVPEDLIGNNFTFRSQSVWPQWISKNICHN